jgi:anti-sigma factor RsiW
MNRDVLERLAADHALGALPPDVGHLLECHLAREPELALAADEIERTVRLARTVLAEHAPSSMPAFPVSGFEQIARWHRQVGRVIRAAALAACVAVGIGIGRFSMPAASSSAPVQPIQVVSAAPVPTHRSAVGAAGDEGGYWSVSRMRSQYERLDRRAAQASRESLTVWQRLGQSG